MWSILPQNGKKNQYHAEEGRDEHVAVRAFPPFSSKFSGFRSEMQEKFLYPDAKM
jgi:hypothetical protein